MLIVTCPGCGIKLKAKAEWAGQRRKCGKCGAVILLQAAPAGLAASTERTVGLADEVAPDQHVHGLVEEHLAPIEVPERLSRTNHYLICDKSKLVATWQNNGNGWMLATSHGYISAVRNPEKLPAQGDFTLVEIHLRMTDEGLRLCGLSIYQLAARWALTNLERGDDAILASVKGPGSLNRAQKTVVRDYLQEHFMRGVWTGAQQVMDYLLNADYHSHSVGTATR